MTASANSVASSTPSGRMAVCSASRRMRGGTWPSTGPNVAPQTLGKPLQRRAGDQGPAEDEGREVGERAAEAAGVVERGVDRVQRGLEREDGGDGADRVVQAVGDGARGHEREEGDRQ